ncbi:hypothetical protein ACUSIJ_20485 [Pseudochelatococcus sp. B33]
MTAAKPGPAETDGGGDGRQPPGVDERLDRELAETFPASDPPSVINPAAGEEPKTHGGEPGRDEDQAQETEETDDTPA